MPPDSTATSPRRAAQATGVCRLLVLHPPASARAGGSKVLEGDVLLSREASTAAGAQGDERLVLDDEEVSRRHAVISKTDDGTVWQLTDEGSHNGTFVNGERIERAVLSPGDVVRVGKHILLLQYLDLPASQRLARRRLSGSPLVGEGPACKWIDEQMVACAEQDAPVLILGESGTGKELVAQHLHVLSGRAGPLVPVNCTALPETVAESELFGHVKGAFSGAISSKDGLFIAAQSGTLLLDELGDMPISIQAKLLRTIETGEVRKVGSSCPLHVDTHVVAATNTDLETAVSEGRFRGDLWARLQRTVIRLPPLRERRDDVLVLLRHFLRAVGSKLSVTAEAAEALLVHDWPYNVRELRNVAEATLLRARGCRAIELEHLPSELTARFASRAGEPAGLPLGRDPDSAEELQRVLADNDWNIAKVAALLGKDRKQIYRWCEGFGIELKRGR